MSVPQGHARRRLAPEVVQTSMMDCGPASLKCLLEGFGVSVSYGRLREACQTDVDGTSIDTLEDVALQLGLDAEQVMLPADHLLLPESGALPALVVVTLPSGVTHFVVVWGSSTGLVQVMDPSAGRRWMTRDRFLQELYAHAMPVSAEAWRSFAAGPGFQSALARRMRAVGVDGAMTAALWADALAHPEWQGLGALDAATRMIAALVDAGALRAGAPTAAVLSGLASRARADAERGGGPVPEAYWSVRPTASPPGEEPTLLMRGAVLLCVRGVRGAGPEGAEPARPLSPELVAALREPPARPGRALWALLLADGGVTPTALAVAFGVTALGATVEVLLFRGLFEIGRYLGLLAQRMAALGVLLGFLLGLLLVELPVMAALQRLGRGLDARLRVAFLEKVPRLGDRYFRSRPTSDMAERSHAMHQLRGLPELGARVVQCAFGLAWTAAGIAWIDPASAPAAVLLALLGLTLPLLSRPLIGERDMRFRVHGGALTRFYLDALHGLMAVRTHSAERALRREHESLLVEWVRAGRSLLRAVLGLEAFQGLVSAGLTVWLVTRYLDRAGDASGVLLLLYWALSLPAVSQELGTLIRQYPAHRNVALRLLEPLGAPDESPAMTAPRAAADPEAPEPAAAPRGVALSLEGVAVRASGHTILEGVDLAVSAGEHVAVVGPSGAGKSSLVGLLLGWHRAAVGTVRVDDQPLDGERLAALRRDTAWVDPAVHLWNRTLLYNLRYGAPEGATASMAALLDDADLRGVLRRLPDGLQSVLGEGGGLVSGGEGQRVRLGRAMMRDDARLVILDEPFRGLDRDRRRALLARARGRWSHATMLCVTHDVGETRGFDRVLVVEGGRVVEDGAPADLAAQVGSRYRALLDADEAVRRGLWADPAWRRLRLDDGRLAEAPPDGPPARGPR